MKTANIILGFGIGLYYSVGVSTSLFWGMMYYSIITGVMLCLIFKDPMTGWDKRFSATITGIIWIIFLTKAIIYADHQLVFDWVRFYTGIFFVALTMIYFIYCVVTGLRHDD